MQMSGARRLLTPGTLNRKTLKCSALEVVPLRPGWLTVLCNTPAVVHAQLADWAFNRSIFPLRRFARLIMNAAVQVTKAGKAWP